MATGPKYYTEEWNKYVASIGGSISNMMVNRLPYYYQGAIDYGYYNPSLTGINNYEKILAEYNRVKGVKTELSGKYPNPNTNTTPMGQGSVASNYRFASRAEMEYLKALAAFEADPSFENFYSGRALGQAKREGQMGTTGKLFRPNTQFAPGYEGRKSKLGADMFQSGPGKGLNKPNPSAGPEYQDYVNPVTGDKYIHKPLPTPRADGNPTTALGGNPVQGTQVTGGIYGGASLPASDQPLASAAPARRPTRLGRV